MLIAIATLGFHMLWAATCFLLWLAPMSALVLANPTVWEKGGSAAQFVPYGILVVGCALVYRQQGWSDPPDVLIAELLMVSCAHALAAWSHWDDRNRWKSDAAAALRATVSRAPIISTVSKCQKCGRRNIIGFRVEPVEAFEAVTLNRSKTSICPSCFDQEAEKAGIRYTLTELDGQSWSDKRRQEKIRA